MKSLEEKALELKCLLAVMSGVDINNTLVLAEIPIVARIALEKADELYENIIEKGV